MRRRDNAVKHASPADDVPRPVPLLPCLLPALGALLRLFAVLRDALAPEDEENGRHVVPGVSQLLVHLDRAEGDQRGDLGEHLSWKIDEKLNGKG